MSEAIQVVRYGPERQALWDSFVERSKNGVFLFKRDYMDYHSARFKDHSLMFFNGDKLIALLPANVKDDVLYSHGGLTFGGMISNYDMKTALMMRIFQNLIDYLKEMDISKMVYKAIPHIYHAAPSEEDLYALFLTHATVVRRDVSSAIYLPERNNSLKFIYGRERMVKKALKSGVAVQETGKLREFMDMVTQVLERRHGTKPVHSYEEMKLLMDRFSNNIKLFTASKDGTMYAGVMIYENKTVAHSQYIANSEAGMKVGALDLVFDHLINQYYVSEPRFFDFGISTEQEGRYLNEGLVWQKEGFGARAVTYDFYELPIIDDKG